MAYCVFRVVREAFSLSFFAVYKFSIQSTYYYIESYDMLFDLLECLYNPFRENFGINLSYLYVGMSEHLGNDLNRYAGAKGDCRGESVSSYMRSDLLGYSKFLAENLQVPVVHMIFQEWELEFILFKDGHNGWKAEKYESCA